MDGMDAFMRPEMATRREESKAMGETFGPAVGQYRLVKKNGQNTQLCAC